MNFGEVQTNPVHIDDVSQDDVFDIVTFRHLDLINGDGSPCGKPRKLYVASFNSFPALIDAANTDKPWDGHAKADLSSHAICHKPDEFYGDALTFPDAIEKATHGWARGLENMERALDAVYASTTFARSPTAMLDVAGSHPVAAVAAAGDPSCMVSPIPVEGRHRPVVRLAVESVYPWFFSAHEIMNYGAGLCAFIDALENDGYRCEIEMIEVCGNHTDADRFMTKTLVKASGEALEMDRMAFALAHPAMLRRLQFSILERLKGGYNRWNVGYGSIVKPAYDIELDPEQVYLHGVSTFTHGCEELKTPEAAYAAMAPKIRQMLIKKYGGNLDIMEDAA